MKTNRAKNWTAVCAAVLTVTAVIRAAADQAAADRPERNYTGTVVSVDPQEHTLNAKGLVLNRKFNVGVNCTYSPLDNTTGTINELRAGEKVAIHYQDVDGVLVADSID